MFIASVIKCAFLRRPHALISAAMPCVARAGHCESLHRQTAVTASVICKSLGLNFRQFSSTRTTNFRTANSFICYTDNDDSETSGNVMINVKTLLSDSSLYLVIIGRKIG